MPSSSKLYLSHVSPLPHVFIYYPCNKNAELIVPATSVKCWSTASTDHKQQHNWHDVRQADWQISSVANVLL